MTSLWLAGRLETSSGSNTIEDVPRFADVVVVGAGITGMMTAVLLARQGCDVQVIEARRMGACTTGNTTGKISLLQGTQLSKIRGKHGNGLAGAYVAGNREGRDWLLAYCAEHGIDVQREDAYTYAQSPQGVEPAQAEFQACEAVGLPVRWCDTADVSLPYHGGVQLADQAQFDPMPLLDALARELTRLGGRLLEQARVTRVSHDRRNITVHVDGGGQRGTMLRAVRLVLATGTPILDRGGYFARLKPSRSYCLAFTLPGPAPRPMMLSADAPNRSLRYAPTTDGERLIVGGAGHTVGRGEPTQALAELESWVHTNFPNAQRTNFWSAQDYTPADALPYVGPLQPLHDGIFVATGFNKWGMTNGAAAALALSARMLGDGRPWADAFASWSPHELRGMAGAIQTNLQVGASLVRGWSGTVTRPVDGGPNNDGQGVVTGPPWRPRAKCRVDGIDHEVSAVCPHLGGIVDWNEADRAWECPLHGSRFAPDGTLLEGPATHGLAAGCDRTRRTW